MRVREAHRAAVTTALEELERYTQARIGGNNPAETTGKFIAAKFEHDTARPVEGYAAPQLHTHAVIFNVTERADGNTRAIQPQSLFDTQSFATAVYQSALTYRLRSWATKSRRGEAALLRSRGTHRNILMPPARARSRSANTLKRRATAARRRRRSPLTPRATGNRSSPPKRFLPPTERWRPVRQPGGTGRRRGPRARSSTGTATGADDRAKEAVSFARDSIFEREAVADERAILRDALRRGMGETSYREFGRSSTAAGSGRVSLRPGQKHDSGRSFTTPETIAAERANIRHVWKGETPSSQ